METETYPEIFTDTRLLIKCSSFENYKRILTILKAKGYTWASGCDLLQKLDYFNSGLQVLSINEEKKCVYAARNVHGYNSNINVVLYTDVGWLDKYSNTNLPQISSTVNEPKMMNVLEFAHTIDPNFLGKWKMYEQVKKGNPQDLVGQLVTSVKGGFGSGSGGVNMKIISVNEHSVDFAPAYSNTKRWFVAYKDLYKEVVLTEYYNEI